MIGKARSSNNSLLSARAAWLIVGCVCAAQVSVAQRILPGEPQISSRVQRLLNEAKDCRDADDFACARASLEKISQRSLSDDERYRYWQSLGIVEFYAGNFTAARDAFVMTAALAKHPGARVDFLRYVAQLHATMGDFRQAYGTLEEMLAEDGPEQYPRRYDLRATAREQAAVEHFQEAYDNLEKMLARNGLVPLSMRHLTNDALWRGFPIYATGDRVLVPLVEDPPAYPREAAAAGLSQGFVELEFIVTQTGVTRDIRVIESSAPVFESAAIEAVESLRYKPALVDGQPVETPVQHRIEFQSGDTDQF